MKQFILSLIILSAATPAMAENCTKEAMLLHARLHSIVAQEEPMNESLSATHYHSSSASPMVILQLHFVGANSGHRDHTEVQCDIRNNRMTVESLRLSGKVVAE
jgi:hypothetical protein